MKPKDLKTAEQLRAARGILNLSQGKLSKLCGLCHMTICRMESEDGTLKANEESIRIVQSVLTDRGIVFIDGGAYRPSKLNESVKFARAS